MTDLRHGERLVLRGRGLYPVDFTSGGDLLVSAGRAVVLLSRDGQTLRRFRYRARNSFAFDERSDTLYFVTARGRLASVHDRRLRLARRLDGIDGSISPPQHGLLVFGGAQRLVVTRTDGSVVARARWRSRLGSDSGVAVSPDGRSFAFRLTGAKRAAATLYVLRAGSTRADAVYRHRLGPSGCAVGANLSWNGRFLLYVSTDGHRAIVDTATHVVTDLTKLAVALPRRSAGEQASFAWASDLRRQS
jgi:hypothetical protein